METILILRQKLIGIYKLNEDKINILAKFIAGIAVFLCMSSLSLGNFGGTKKIGIILIGSIFAVVSSPTVFIAISGIGAVVFIAAASVETAVIAAILFFLLFVFYGRIFSKASLLFIAMLVCFKIKIPYVVPILGGIYFGAEAILPCFAAMFINQMTPLFVSLVQMSPTAEFSVSTMPDILFNMYTYIFTDGLEVLRGSAYAAAVMIITTSAAWAVSSLHINYEKETAIAVSAVVTVIGMFLAVIIGGSTFSVFGLPLFTAVSAVIAYIISLFDDLPDYRHTERVKFQDKNYVYYVKAVPKIKMPESRGSGSED